MDVLFQEVPCPPDDVLEGQNGSGAVRAAPAAVIWSWDLPAFETLGLQVWTTWEAFANKTIQVFTATRPDSGSVLAGGHAAAGLHLTDCSMVALCHRLPALQWRGSALTHLPSPAAQHCLVTYGRSLSATSGGRLMHTCAQTRR